MCQLTIRKLEPADIPAVAEVVVVAWQTAYRKILPETLRDNLPARAFYEKAGLVLDGAIKEIERGGEKSVEVRYRRPI
jgi:hypothetical protein